jgi:hypothetical protein
MRLAIFVLIFAPTVSTAEQWVEVTALRDTIKTQQVNLSSVFVMEGTRVVVTRAIYKETSSVDREIDALEVDCISGTYRFLTSARLGRDSSFRAVISKDDPSWRPSLSAADPNGWLQRACNSPTVRSLPKVKLLYGALEVKATDDDYEILGMMEIEGQRRALTSSISSCHAGFGALTIKGSPDETLQVLSSGDKREDSLFALLCKLSLLQAAYLEYRAERARIDDERRSAALAADQKRRELLLQYLLNQSGRPLPESTPPRPRSNDKAETVCRHNDVSGETRCTTTDSP